MRTTIALSTLLLCALGAGTAQASCKFRAERQGAVDIAGATKVVLRVGAGDLNVIGTPGATKVAARGAACASSQELLDALLLDVRREGDVIFVEGGPRSLDKKIWEGDAYAYIDVGVAIPPGVPLEARDSSGDIVIRGIERLDLHDSSGDIEIANVGSVEIEDSSGDVEIDGATGDVIIALDGSGDIEIENVGGRVAIGSDGSGDIRVEDVAGGVTVAADGSGSIVVASVKGDLTISQDGSGGVDYRDIGGTVTLP